MKTRINLIKLIFILAFLAICSISLISDYKALAEVERVADEYDELYQPYFWELP